MAIQHVQSLSESNPSNLPPQYIQPPHLRPNPHPHQSQSLPILDLDHAASPLPRIGRLCREWGAFQVSNHGVPPQLLRQMKDLGARFFRSPAEVKRRYACDPGSAATEGYGSRMLEKEDGVLDWRDYFDHHTLPESRRDVTRWPDFLENYRFVHCVFWTPNRSLRPEAYHDKTRLKLSPTRPVLNWKGGRGGRRGLTSGRRDKFGVRTH